MVVFCTAPLLHPPSRTSSPAESTLLLPAWRDELEMQGNQLQSAEREMASLYLKKEVLIHLVA
jgi:hypothetical protein